MAGTERYVAVTGAGARLVLPAHFRPVLSTPRDNKVEVVRAFGYPEFHPGGMDDGYEAAEEGLIQVQGRIKAVSESALMSLLTDWRRHVRATTLWRREVTENVARREWGIQGGSLSWAHPEGLPSEFADVLITLIKTAADRLDDLTPAG